MKEVIVLTFPLLNIGVIVYLMVLNQLVSFLRLFCTEKIIMCPGFPRVCVYIPGTLLNTLHMFSHLILPATPLRSQHFLFFAV